MQNKVRTILALILNAILFFIGPIGLFYSGSTHKAGLFQFYTQDSNIFAFLLSGITAAFLLRKLLRKKELPQWVRFLK